MNENIEKIKKMFAKNNKEIDEFGDEWGDEFDDFNISEEEELKKKANEEINFFNEDKVIEFSIMKDFAYAIFFEKMDKTYDSKINNQSKYIKYLEKELSEKTKYANDFYNEVNRLNEKINQLQSEIDNNIIKNKGQK